MMTEAGVPRMTGSCEVSLSFEDATLHCDYHKRENVVADSVVVFLIRKLLLALSSSWILFKVT